MVDMKLMLNSLISQRDETRRETSLRIGPVSPVLLLVFKSIGRSENTKHPKGAGGRSVHQPHVYVAAGEVKYLLLSSN